MRIRPAARSARFHQAAAGFGRPRRDPAVLMPSVALVTAPDPLMALDRLLQARPGLARAVAGRPLESDFARHLQLWVASSAPALAALQPQWVHGDWHASNLTWTSDEPTAGVAGVLDLGLSNCTFAVHDLAVAIERNTVDWLDLSESGTVEARI